MRYSHQTISRFKQIQSGVTLVEVIIVVAIIGILSAFVVPSYSNFITQQRRADAHHLLNKNAQKLQRCLTLVGAYNAPGGGCNIQSISQEGYYTLSTVLTAQTWSLTATPVAGGRQEKDTKCATISLTHTGQKSATGTEPGSCW